MGRERHNQKIPSVPVLRVHLELHADSEVLRLREDHVRVCEGLEGQGVLQAVSEREGRCGIEGWKLEGVKS